jgi:hypothetical protein
MSTAVKVTVAVGWQRRNGGLASRTYRTSKARAQI